MRDARRSLPAFAALVLAASLLLHGALVIVALFAPRTPPVVEPREIPVEVVQEAPPAAPEPPQRRPPAAEPPPPPRAPDPAAAQRAGLERELAALKAEQAALKAGAGGAGPMRDSLRALALPAVAADDGDGEVVGYQSLVFSQLAKAKEALPPRNAAGVVGVRFSVDENGGLIDVDVAVSSGVAKLDADAVAIVRRAAPFPRPPSGAERVFAANVAYAAAP